MKDRIPAPDSGIISMHYGISRLLGADGCAHTRIVVSDASLGRPYHYIGRERLEKKQKREIEICLHCTRQDCTGGAGCFKKIQKKQKEVTQND